MRFNAYSLKNSDGIYAMPFYQLSDELAAKVTYQYFAETKIDKFDKIELVKVGSFDTTSGKVEAIEPVVLNVDDIYCRMWSKNYSEGVETSSLAKEVENEKE